MKVNGQLEVAQLEQIANAAPTPTPTGRIYIDITTPTAAIPRFYNGSAWIPFALGQATSLISQNSGLAVTVNWALGLNQKIVLTNNTVISFQNPVAGATHTLVIQQDSLSPFIYVLNMADQGTKRQPYQPIGVIAASNSASYSWLYSPGVQAAITNLFGAYVSPATLPPNGCVSLDLSADQKTLLMARGTTPFLLTYDVTDALGNAFYYGALGAQNVTTPPTLPGNVGGIRYLPDNRTAVVTNQTTPFIQLFVTNRGTPFAASTGPTTLPTGGALCACAHPTGLLVGVGHGSAPNMELYPNTGGTIGFKLTNPATLPVSNVTSMAFSPLGDYLVASVAATPFIQAWAINYSNVTQQYTFGAAVANPATLPAGATGAAGRYTAWRPQGDFIALCMSTTPFIYVVPFNRATGTFGAPLTVPVALSSAATSVNWTPDGQYLLVGGTTTTFLYIYDFGANLNLANPLTLLAPPGSAVNDICMSASGETVFIATASTPFIWVYQMPTKVRNYLRIAGP